MERALKSSSDAELPQEINKRDPHIQHINNMYSYMGKLQFYLTAMAISQTNIVVVDY